MKTAIFEKSKCFQFVTYLLWLNLFKRSETMHLQFRWHFFGDNQFNNNTKKVFGHTGLKKNLNSLYP